MKKLDNIKIFTSPITKECYLCSVNSKSIITNKKKLNEQEMIEFIFGIVNTLENKYGCDIKVEDSKKQINIEILYKEDNNDR